jgi:transposase
MPGIGKVLSEVERLRAQVAERDALLAERDAWLAERDAWLAERDAQLAEREAVIADQAAKLTKREAEVLALTEAAEELARRLALLRLKLFGRKNERYVGDDQAMLPFVPATPEPPPRLPVPESDTDSDETAATTPKKEKGKPRRRNLAEMTGLPLRHLRCRRDPDAACQTCGGALRDIGEAVSWRLEWKPGSFERIRVARDKCACPNCPGQGVLVAPEPAFAIRYGLPGNGLLAQVLVDKFADRIPLNLQVTRMRRVGVDLSTSTLSGWVGQLDRFVAPVIRAVYARLMASGWLQGDDTGFPVQDGTDGSLRKGRLWAYTDQQEVMFHFTDDKSGKGPEAFLAPFAGDLVLFDGGSEFNLAVGAKQITRAGCWSHLRRYFFDARLYHPVEAHLALGTIRDLFELEASLKGAPPAGVQEVRQRDARPLVDGLFTWVRAISTTVRPSSLLGEAVTYATNQEASLRVFLERPELPIHNNLSELQLRGPVVGRKTWLFAGSEGGARAAASFFTLVGSCMLQGIDPWAYLFDLLNRLPDHPASRIDELTPLGWRRAREA